MESFNKHECSYFSVALLLKNVVLYYVFFEVRMLEELMLHFCEEEQEKESHIDLVLLQQTYRMTQNYIKLHRLLSFINFLALVIRLVMHNQSAVLGVDVVWVCVSVNVNCRGTQEQWHLVDQDQEKHNSVVCSQGFQDFCVFAEELLGVNDVL